VFLEHKLGSDPRGCVADGTLVLFQHKLVRQRHGSARLKALVLFQHKRNGRAP